MNISLATFEIDNLFQGGTRTHTSSLDGEPVGNKDDTRTYTGDLNQLNQMTPSFTCLSTKTMKTLLECHQNLAGLKRLKPC